MGTRWNFIANEKEAIMTFKNSKRVSTNQFHKIRVNIDPISVKYTRVCCLMRYEEIAVKCEFSYLSQFFRDPFAMILPKETDNGPN